MIAIYGGFIIVIFTGFSNQIFNQMPLGPIMYICMVYLTISDKLELEYNTQHSQEKINSTNSVIILLPFLQSYLNFIAKKCSIFRW
jgi:hypothetical protein